MKRSHRLIIYLLTLALIILLLAIFIPQPRPGQELCILGILALPLAALILWAGGKPDKPNSA